jgi:hypothetical protein
MEKIKSSTTIEISIMLTLTEIEARALNAIAGYGTDAFLTMFYNQLGKCYLKPCENGVRSLFETIKNELPKHLDKVDKTRNMWKNEGLKT